MHPCLQIPELISLICDYLRTPDDASDMLSMLLTCRAFQDPALDRIWEVLPDVDPLLYCFPEDVLKRRWNETKHYMGWSLLRPPQPDDWTEVLSHAARVREIGVASWPRNNLRPGLFLGNQSYKGPLFPRLRRIFCETFNGDEGRFCRVIASTASLDAFQYLFRPRDFPESNLGMGEEDDGNEDEDESENEESEDEDEDESENEDEDDEDVGENEDEGEGEGDVPPDMMYTAGLAECLQASRASLRDLEIETTDLLFCCNVTTRPFDDINEAVCQLHALRRVAIYALLDDHSLAHLAHLPDLTSLRFDFVFEDFPLSQVLRSDASNFRALTNLTIKIISSDLARPIAFFNNIHPAGLQDLDIGFDWEPRVADLNPLTQSIVRFSSLRSISLKSLAMISGRSFDPLPEEEELWPIPFDILAPLFHISQLRELCVDALPISIEPRDVRRISDAWRNLEKLALNPRDSLNQTTVGAQDLCPLAGGCPRLEALGIPLRGGRDDGAPDELTKAPSVKTLQVGWPHEDWQAHDEAALKEVFHNAVIDYCYSFDSR